MPLLSIVIAAYNTEAYIGETLASLLRQQWPNVEIIVVDDGSTDATAQIVSACRDPRVRLIHGRHAGPGAARNTGAAQARGRYLAFFDSDDIADPFYYRQAIMGLERSGSDFALGSYSILVHGKRRPAPEYIRDLHRRSRRGVTLADVPLAMTNALMCTRVYRRDFYDAQVGPQPEGVFFEDQILTMRAFVRARAFDLVHQPALQWRRRETKDATTQQAAEVDNLIHRVEAYRHTADFLEDAGLGEIRRARLAQILVTEQLTLSQLVVASSRYQKVAAEFLSWAIGEIGQEAYDRQVSVPDRVLQALVMRADLATVRSFLFAGGRICANWVYSRDATGRLTGWLPRWGRDATIDVPATARVPGPDQVARISPAAILDHATYQACAESDIHEVVASQTPGDATGESGSAALRCWYWRTAAPTRPQVYLQGMPGEVACDSQLALAQELDRRGLSDLVVWEVESAKTARPRGHRSVVVGTQAYWEALATSSVVCATHALPGEFVRRPGQRVVQAHHGHPFAGVGVPVWRDSGATQAQMAMSLHALGAWDALVSPSPLATRLYRETLPIRAEMWELGSPRDDALVLPREGLREQVRARLGVRPDQVCVLYAPTYRGYAAQDPSASSPVGILDPAWLARRLGNGYVVAMRGHPSHRKAGWRAPTGRGVVDVTGYPDVNELMIASDLGLFDYSSMRFDYLLTDKPMVYFTPDKERYMHAVQPLWEYGDTIAGACVSRREQVPGAIIEAVHNRGAWDSRRAALRKVVAPLDDGHAASRLADRVCAWLERG